MTLTLCLYAYNAIRLTNLEHKVKKQEPIRQSFSYNHRASMMFESDLFLDEILSDSVHV